MKNFPHLYYIYIVGAGALKLLLLLLVVSGFNYYVLGMRKVIKLTSKR